MFETWKQIPGFEGFYEVSNNGNVRSVDRVIVRNDGRQERRKAKTIKAMSIGRDGGYLGVTISRPGKEFRGGIHVLVYQAFHGEIADGLEIDHIDGDKRNNIPSNLRVATRGQNHANNPKPRTNTSGVKGVSFDKGKRRWRASIKVAGKTIHLGRFFSIEDAALAYRLAAVRYFGEFARVG